MQEPIAFWGGFTAGALALNLKEVPLRSWIERTAADAKVGIIWTVHPCLQTLPQR